MKTNDQAPASAPPSQDTEQATAAALVAEAKRDSGAPSTALSPAQQLVADSKGDN